MTAKRFKFNGRNNCIEYDGKSILLDSYGENIEELLNELDEDFDDALNTISKIQEENHALQEEIKDYNDVLARLEEQNEQLKKETQQVKDILKEYDDFEFFVDSAIAIGFIERIAWAVGMELEE